MSEIDIQNPTMNEKLVLQVNAYLTGKPAQAFTKCLEDLDPLKKSQLALKLIKEGLVRRGYLTEETQTCNTEL